jgi:hypothetical protein
MIYCLDQFRLHGPNFQHKQATCEIQAILAARDAHRVGRSSGDLLLDFVCISIFYSKIRGFWQASTGPDSGKQGIF